jgi:uncharacterized protein (DUF169 family)
MSAYQAQEDFLTSCLNLSRRPVAIRYLTAPPADVPRFQGMTPSGCTFWKLAAEGRSFWTAQEDHYNCPIGSYTHNIELPPARRLELQQTLGWMADIGYLRMEEIPSIFRLPSPPAAILYRPLGEASEQPDVVVLSARPGRLGLLLEAALRAGVWANLPVLTRPTCMALPAALNKGAVISTACIGNRIYTDLPEDESYVAFKGADLFRLCEELRTILSANQQLAEYHRARRAALTRL